MNNCKYMSNRNRFKDIGTFLLKKSLCHSCDSCEMFGHSIICLLSNLFNSHDLIKSKFNRLLRLTIP